MSASSNQPPTKSSAPRPAPAVPMAPPADVPTGPHLALAAPSPRSPAIPRPALSSRSTEILAPAIPTPNPHPAHAPSSPASEPRSSLADTEMRDIIAHVARTVGDASDLESSFDIPPPMTVDRGSKEPGERRDPYIGTTFDHRYKIEKLIGEGGMGFVYLARHKVIDKRVAVKVLRADLARDREILDRFVQEAKSASSIGNAHIVDISDFGDLPDGSTYFVMEYLEGHSLTHRIEQPERMPIDRICKIGVQMCDGLAGAHAAGIVHRDLKPDNIFLVSRGGDRDFVKILDFGIAKVSKAGNTKLTRAGAVFGTPHYMSPEQAAGAPVDRRTDIYSVGVLLYEMTAGQLPFNADNFMGILTQHMYKAPVPIRALVPAPDCPPGLEAIILKCLSKKPEMRYGSMDELARDLERVGRGEVPEAVGEMMTRSNGFNVPHDYFKLPALVPATPAAARRSGPRAVWIAGALAAVGLVTAIIIKGSATDAGMPPAATALSVAAPPAPTGPKKVGVIVAWSPSAAVGVLDGKELRSPAEVMVEEGRPVTLEIRADGYEPSIVTLDGKETTRQVDLVAIPKPAPSSKPVAGPRPTAGRPSKVRGNGEVVEPW